MRKLWGFLIGLISLGVLAALFIPLSISFWLEKHYEQVFNHLNQLPQVSVKVTQFHRGWFVSRATAVVTIWGPWLKPRPGVIQTKPNQPLAFSLEQRIIHGPVIISHWDNRYRFSLAKAFIESQGFDPNFLFKSATTIHLNNLVQSNIQAQRIRLMNGVQQLIITGLKSHLIFAMPKHDIQADTAIDLVQVFKEQPALILENIHSHVELQPNTPLWDGTKNLQVGKATYFLAPNKFISLEDVSLQHEQSNENDTTTINMIVHAAQVTFDALNLRPLDMKFSIRSLNTKMLLNLVRMSLKFKPMSQVDIEQLKILYLPVINLLNEGIDIHLDYLNAQTPDGLIHTTADLNFPKQVQSPNLALILANAQGRIDLQMPLNWLTMQLQNLYENQKLKWQTVELQPATAAQQQVKTWINNKKLMQNGNTVQTVITYDKGSLLINGVSPSYQTPTPAPTSTAKTQG